MAAARLQRAAISMQIPVTMLRAPGPDWRGGPYANQWRRGTSRVVSGDRVGRRKYLNEGLDEILYEKRWHKIAPPVPAVPSHDGLRVKAIEVWGMPTTAPRPNGMLIVHLAIDPSVNVLEAINQVVNHNPSHGGPMREWLNVIVSPWARVLSSHRRAQHVSLVTSSAEIMPDTPLTKVGDKINGHNLWLTSLIASGRYGPDVDMMTGAGVFVAMSNRIRGLVGRNGIGLVGLLPDNGESSGEQGFDYGGLEFFAEGLYTDTLLLAQLQRVLLGELRDELTDAMSRGATKDDLQKLERRLLEFRRQYWRTDFAPQGSQDDFLVAYHSTNSLPGQLDEFASQLSEYASQVQRVEQELTNAVLGIIAIIGLPFTVMIAIWDGIGNESVFQLPCALMIASILSGAIFAFPGGRAILKPLLRRKRA